MTMIHCCVFFTQSVFMKARRVSISLLGAKIWLEEWRTMSPSRSMDFSSTNRTRSAPAATNHHCDWRACATVGTSPTKRIAMEALVARREGRCGHRLLIVAQTVSLT